MPIVLRFALNTLIYSNSKNYGVVLMLTEGGVKDVLSKYSPVTPLIHIYYYCNSNCPWNCDRVWVSICSISMINHWCIHWTCKNGCSSTNWNSLHIWSSCSLICNWNINLVSTYSKICSWSVSSCKSNCICLWNNNWWSDSWPSYKSFSCIYCWGLISILNYIRINS